MRRFGKIVILFINFLCYAITLIYPSNVTPFALIPSIATSVTWIFSADKIKGWVGNTVIAFVSLLGGFVLFCGLTADIKVLADKSGAFVRFKAGALWIAGQQISYTVFVVLSVAAFLIPAIVELVFVNMPKSKKSSSDVYSEV